MTIAELLDRADDSYFSDSTRLDAVSELWETMKGMHFSEDWSNLRYAPSGRYLSDSTAEIEGAREMVATINCILANGDSSAFDLYR